MSKPRPFFHDRRILLLLTINTFLTAACLIVALLPLAESGGTIISQYRANLGLDGYKAGNLSDIASFGAFALVIYVFQLVAALKMYEERKPVGLTIMALTTVVLIFALVVVNALLELR